jgi:serine/threonine protein phosphatase 1
MPRRLFIGDVHGHYDGLMRLIDLVQLESDDHLYFVGDLVDRGCQSAAVVDFVRKHATGCVLGNHEQLLLDAFGDRHVNANALQAWLYSGGQATLSSYERMDLLTEHVNWLRSLPIYLDLGDVWLVHAGLDPERSLAEQTADECCWIRDAFHDNPHPYFSDKLVITGHTITFTFPSIAPGQLVAGPGWLNIDTGAYHPRSGWLTALDLDNEQVYQTNVYDCTQRQRPLAAAISPFAGSRQRSAALVNG